ncbi:MAG TPA: hypothetical protein VHV78_09775 [Gemmatimonadaceae bacterium]|nr:hypothetical protein [Gemmatimonadaceae bacterium]
MPIRHDQGAGAKSRLVKQWVREALALPPDVTIIVSELACSEPGCPPVETVIALLYERGDHRQLKIDRALTDVSRADVESTLQGEDHGHQH